MVVLLIAIIIGLTLQNTTKKSYNIATEKGGVYLFGIISALFAMVYFMFVSDGFDWTSQLLLYALSFAISYAANVIFSVLAVSCGSLSLTALLCSYSLMIPTMYGVLFLREGVGVSFAIGLTLLVVSLLLVNKNEGKASINIKWLLFTLLALVGNGMCCVVQNMQQRAFAGEYKSEFMIMSLGIVVLILLPMLVIFEKRKVITYIKKGWHLGAICGVMNGLVNHFVMILSDRMSISLLFPLVSGGSIVATYFMSKYIYKEKLSVSQLIGFSLGTLSVVVLSI